MAELEIHHEEHHDSDPNSRRVGVLAAVLAVALAIVTIASHRTHTAAIMHKSSANDAWAHYQATRVKYHNLELGQNLYRLVGQNRADTAQLIADGASEMRKYDAQAQKILSEAEDDDKAADSDETRALRYDLGEGLLEIALVLSSLYFISKKGMFPLMGIIAGLFGIGIALTGIVAG